jgi:hypothetical protein
MVESAVFSLLPAEAGIGNGGAMRTRAHAHAHTSLCLSVAGPLAADRMVDDFDRELAICLPEIEAAPVSASAEVERVGAADRWLDALLDDGSRLLVGEGNLNASRDVFDRAYRAAEAVGDGDGMAIAVLGLAGLWVHEHRDTTAAVLTGARLRAALSRVDPSSSLALRLRARLAGEADYQDGRHDTVLAVLEEARQANDPLAHASALSIAHHCLLGPDHGALRRTLAKELITAATRTGRRGDLLMGVLWRTVDLFLDADPHAERTLSELRGMLARADHLAVGYVAQAIDVMLAIRAGRFEHAWSAASDCAVRGATAGDADATGWYGGQIIAIRWFEGRIAELVPMLADLVHSPTLSLTDYSYYSALAVAAASAGDQREATGALGRLTGRDLGELPRSSSWLVSMYGCVEAAHLLGDVPTSARAYELLLPYARLPMMASLGVACFGSVRHALGVAALTMGAPDLAVGHFRDAIDDNLALGHWPATVLSRYRLAEALTRQGASGDAAAARQARTVAEREAVGLRMTLPQPVGSPASAPGWRADPGTPDHRVRLRRRGRQWRIELGDRAAVVEHGVGMLYLASLLANPGREIPAVELAAGPGTSALGTEAATASSQPVLDDVAMREYKRRLSDLADELSTVDDSRRAKELRVEREWLLAELGSSTGRQGRARPFADSGERARIAVGKAIRRALDRIEAAEPVIGGQLRAAVQTGTRCCYRPEMAR